MLCGRCGGYGLVGGNYCSACGGTGQGRAEWLDEPEGESGPTCETDGLDADLGPDDEDCPF